MAMTLLAIVSVVGGAEVAPAAKTVGFLDWFMQNSTIVFAAALALSELLALIPGFQANGILEGIIKALKLLSAKPEQPPVA